MASRTDLDSRANEYQEFLDNRLQTDLARLSNCRVITLQEQADYKALQRNLRLLLQVTQIPLCWSC